MKSARDVGAIRAAHEIKGHFVIVRDAGLIYDAARGYATPAAVVLAWASAEHASNADGHAERRSVARYLIRT